MVKTEEFDEKFDIGEDVAPHLKLNEGRRILQEQRRVNMTIDQEEIEQIKDSIVRLYQPDMIILFGSWARGDASEQSDVDLLVISDREKHLPRYKRGLDVRLQLSQFKTPKDILFYTHDDVERWRNIPQAFINTVLREGQVLYER
jgi:uncharacterized protein